MLGTVAKENTGNGLGRELRPLTRGKENIAQTPEHTKMSIPGRTREQTLARTATLKMSAGLKVDEIDSSGDCLSP